MTTRYPFDRQVASWLEAERPGAAPEHILEGVRAGVATTRRRPSWLVGDRWTWRHAAAVRTAVRAVAVGAVLASLIAILYVVAGILGSPRPAPPFGVTNPGRIAFDTADGIVLSNPDGSDRIVIAGGDGTNVSPTWSRDGLQLAFWHRAGETGPWSLVVVDAHGEGRAVLTDGVNLEARETIFNQPSNLSWSPDSRRVAFAADDPGGSSVFVATLGRVGAERLTDPDLEAIDVAWAPRGDVIAFQSQKTRTLHVVAVDGSGERRLSGIKNTTLWPDWSPDGSQLATTAGSTRNAEIFIVEADGSSFRNVSLDPSFELSPSWSPDGHHLAWARAPTDGSARAYVVVLDLDTGRAVEIRVAADLAAPVWAPDGKRVYSYGTAPDGAFNAVLVLDPAGIAPVVRLPAEGNIGSGNWQRLP